MEECEKELKNDIVKFGGPELLAKFPDNLIFEYKNESIADLFAGIIPAEKLAALKEQDQRKVLLGLVACSTMLLLLNIFRKY